MTAQNWKIVTGENGEQYFEVNAQIVMPSQPFPAAGVLTIGTVGGLSIIADPNVPQGTYVPMPQGFTWGGLAAPMPPPEPEPEPLPEGRFENLDFHDDQG